jgi:hypothetical protein
MNKLIIKIMDKINFLLMDFKCIRWDLILNMYIMDKNI